MIILYIFPVYTFSWPYDGPQCPKHVVIIVNKIQDSCVLTYPTPSLITYNTTGMMHLKIIYCKVCLCEKDDWWPQDIICGDMLCSRFAKQRQGGIFKDCISKMCVYKILTSLDVVRCSPVASLLSYIKIMGTPLIAYTRALAREVKVCLKLD